MTYRSRCFAGAALSLLMAAGAAHAEDAASAAKAAPAKADAGQVLEEVVITGSRLKTSEFAGASPVQVVTALEALGKGMVDTTEIIQSTPAAGSATQQVSDATFLVPSTGGFGANTIDLRGLGAARTLTLLNGHRVGPAGISGTVGSADLNVIPSSIIERTEFLTSGASSVYGSDAVAGVVNIITKKDYDGGYLRAYGTGTEQGGGNTYQVSGGWGKAFDRGSIMLGAYAYQRQSLRARERSYLDCTADLAFDPTTGAQADIRNPDGSIKCWGVSGYLFKFAGAPGTGLNASGFFSPDASATAGSTNLSNLNGYRRMNNSAMPNTQRYDGYYPECSGGVCRSNRHVLSPVRRYSLTAFGDFDLNAAVQLYGEALLSRRTSVQDTVYSLATSVAAANPNNPFNYANNPSFVNSAGTPLASAIGQVQMQYMQQTAQQVDYGNVVVGARGDFDQIGFLSGVEFLQDWDWDLHAQYSQSQGEYSQTFFYADRVNATIGSVACDTALLTSIKSCPTGGVNWFKAYTSGFTAEERAFLTGVDTGHTTYEQAYVEGIVRGPLLRLPAGEVQTAFGFHARRERISDVPGPNATNRSTIINYDPTWKPTKGSEGLGEVFGEASIPLLRDLPFVERLQFDVSGRWSDYEDYEGAGTYKASLAWKVNPWLMFRATQGTSFRAPRLYEMFLQPSSGNSGRSATDPCYNWVNKGTTLPTTVLAACSALFRGVNYNPTSPGNAVVSTSGGLDIVPETSRTNTVGVVLTPTFMNASLTVDYYDIHIEDTIAQIGSYNIAYLCLLSGSSVGDPFCNLLTRNADGTLATITNNYVNKGDVFTRGLDVVATYTTPTPFGRLDVRGAFNWVFENANATLKESPVYNYNGNIGLPDFNGNISTTLRRGNWRYTADVKLVSKMSNTEYYTGAISDIVTNYRNTGVTVYEKRHTEFYSNWGLSAATTFNDWDLTLGVRNLFDEEPPALSIGSGGWGAWRVGTTSPISQFDLLGRAYYMSLGKRF